MIIRDNLYTDTVERFQGADARDFGTYVYWGLSAHRVADDSIAIGCDLDHIADIHPDNSITIHAAKLVKQRNYLSRLSALFSARAYLDVSSTTRASGLTIITVFAQFDNSLGTVTQVQNRLRIYPDGKLEVVDPILSVVDKDNQKYREFNKILKALKAVLYAKAKMGVYNSLFTKNYWYWTLNDEQKIRDEEFGKDSWPRQSERVALTYQLALRWAENRDNALVDRIAKLAFLGHRSQAEDMPQNALNRIKSCLTLVQQSYLRKECVTISESPTLDLDADDPNRELQPTAGLREVPVPSEA